MRGRRRTRNPTSTAPHCPTLSPAIPHRPRLAVETESSAEGWGNQPTACKPAPLFSSSHGEPSPIHLFEIQPVDAQGIATHPMRVSGLVVPSTPVSRHSLLPQPYRTEQFCFDLTYTLRDFSETTRGGGGRESAQQLTGSQAAALFQLRGPLPHLYAWVSTGSEGVPNSPHSPATSPPGRSPSWCPPRQPAATRPHRSHTRPPRHFNHKANRQSSSIRPGCLESGGSGEF